jgi:ferredoxin
MMVRIVHYREKCIGCNACVEVAPDRWRISRKDGKSTLVGGLTKKGIQTILVSGDELNENKNAADNCPVRVIRVDIICS